ncbi:DUF402 domain-containing protein [Alicyclobacillus acidocaldarius]|uniref:DUF402 domain-containing protein n=1 Tax=Alicyclobacillus acidocaldarius (strain Tc-4-1) TaxID=1048834 RepID=F8ID54_ALIAT|nr:DUF402 domain-containing protein [Alicyclobacillus acidocaldarius]AEJ42520.1 protein of unknown function DUF402 [Alicyclobacillus acidocaldarius subsp. acidocaldarius Tc-4-1]
MRLISVRPDGALHRVWSAAEPGRFGGWWIPPGTPVEDDGGTWSSPYPVAALAWPHVWFQVFILLKPDRTDYYVNICTPPCLGTDVVWIDLDLDVRVESGRAWVADEDEFQDRSRMYPPAWRTAAQQAVVGVQRAVKFGAHPFRPSFADALRAEWILRSRPGGTVLR